MAKRGRPKKAATKQKAIILRFRVTLAESQQIKKSAGKNLSAWLRQRVFLAGDL